MTEPAGHTKQPMLKVIRAKCLDCAGSPGEVRGCTSEKCALWPYRMGRNPFRQGRALEASEARALREKRFENPSRANCAQIREGEAI